MANFKTHALVGGGVGFAAYCAKYSIQKTYSPETRFDLGQAAAWAGVGVLAASIPDWLEPATSPNHRGFFHSFAILGTVLWLLTIVSTGTATTAGLLVVAGLAYTSHLAMDACTRRSLPWI